LHAANKASGRAVKFTPENDSELPVRLNNLSVALQLLYEETGEANYLADAIDVQKEALNIIPGGIGQVM
jgi:hypothetical protein